MGNGNAGFTAPAKFQYCVSVRGLSLRVAMCVAVLSVGAAVGGDPAHAAPIDKRELEARADFAAARYQKAIDTFAQLFADTADPLYLRNIGRCYQKMKRPQEAIDTFQEYLLKGRNLSKRERQEIDGYIKEMQALKASEAPPPAPSPAASSAPPPAAAAASAPGLPNAPRTEPTPASARRRAPPRFPPSGPAWPSRRRRPLPTAGTAGGSPGSPPPPVAWR